MDSAFLVNHGEVNSVVKSLEAYIETDILSEAEAGYRKINELLGQVDGATNTQLIEAMEQNLEKTKAASGILGKLLVYIEGVSREFETEDAKMAKDVSTSEGGAK